jgi:hypothetical protein
MYLDTVGKIFLHVLDYDSSVVCFIKLNQFRLGNKEVSRILGCYEMFRQLHRLLAQSLE